jgi:hypothetical protein
VTEEFARHELRLTQSVDEAVAQVAKAERCEKTKELMYGDGEETGVDNNQQGGEGWSTNWRSYVELGDDC